MADTGGTDDDQGSSSNPTTPIPPLPENTPRRRRLRGRGRGRDSGSGSGGGARGLISPHRRDGGAGSSSASSSVAGVSGQYGGFLEAPVEALPILDSGNIAAAAAGLVIGRSPSAGKRVRESGSGSGGYDQGSPVNCTVCGKELKSPKALYGHMRAVHPGSQYVPPQVLTTEEERVLSTNPPVLEPAARGGGDDVEEGEISEGGGTAAPMELEEPPRRLPDLNFPPPPDEDT